MKKICFILSFVLLASCDFDLDNEKKDEPKNTKYEYVDLGLPSGLKWATMNVGATVPTDFGYYLSWGEMNEKTSYTWADYRWCSGKANTLTKYCADEECGKVDGLKVLEAADDVATKLMGNDWRMPTSAEYEELIKECTWEWVTSYNNVEANGYVITGHNGKSIFFPAGGAKMGTELYSKGVTGGYWSSSLREDKYLNNSAILIMFEEDIYRLESEYRMNGFNVRAVRK
ncbi:MAG: hypothetical protein J6Y15_02320 [Bacteroidaceae bacterium]|nr:hypothetical protein [Bacteroidaceae bacterium]